MPERLSPEKLPDPWLIDSEYLLTKSARIRRAADSFTTKTLELVQPSNTVIDALWSLEEHLRYLLHLHREGQRAFARKTVTINPKKRTLRTVHASK